MSFIRQHSLLLAPARILRLALDKLVLPDVRSGRWGALATALLFTLAFAQPGAAQTGSFILVTTTADKISSTGGCSLKEAIYSANFSNNVAVDSINTDGTDHLIPTGCVAGTGDDTIVLPSSAVLQMSTVTIDAHNPYGPTATPIITSNITIEANGATLKRMSTANFRAFAIGTTGHLTIRNVHIKGFTVKGGNGSSGGGGGMGAGGAIYVQGGGLGIQFSTFDGNGATGGNGSAINSAAGGGGGGLSGNGGQPGFNSDFVGGGGGGGSRGDGGTASSLGGGGGGTVTDGFSPATTFLTDGGFNCGGFGGAGSGVIFSDNDGHAGFCPGGGGGGGVTASDIPIPSPPPVSGNGGNGNYGGGGGGAGGGGSSTGNGGDGGFGGGGGSSSYFPGGSSGNGGNGGFGGGGGGGQGGPGQGGVVGDLPGFFGGGGDQPHGGGGGALGGAIFNHGGTINIKDSTFTANFVTRGLGSGGVSDPGQDAGGAIFSLDGSLTVIDSTISGNGSTGLDGGITVIILGISPPVPDAAFVLDDTIVAGNGPDECRFFSLNPMTPVGAGNLIENNASCPGVVATADPQLGPLQDNGGFTPTMAISTTSSAWNTADADTSLGSDQRGQVRPAMNGLFDIGAFELCEILGFIVRPCPPIKFVVAETEPLTMLVSPPVGGSTTPPSGENDEPLGSVTVLLATPNPGYSFISWTGAVADTNNPNTTVTMDQAQTVTANFVAQPTTMAGNIIAKAGPQNARTWTLSLLDNGPGGAYGTTVPSLTLVQVSGAACTPVIGTAFPLAVGDIPPAQTGIAQVTLDFTGCAASVRFTANFTYSANGGTVSGFVVRYNQFQ